MRVDESVMVGQNAFTFATMGENIDIMKYLDDQDSSLKFNFDTDGYTALTLAVKYTKTEIVKVLIDELEMDVGDFSRNIKTYGRNVFSLAAESNNVETCRYLNDLNPNLKWEADMIGNSALYLAAQHGNLETLMFLVEEMGMTIGGGDPSGNSTSTRKKRAHNFDVELLSFVPHTNSTDYLLGHMGRNIFLSAAEGGKVENLRYIDGLNPNLKYGKKAPNHEVTKGHENTAVTLAAQDSNRATMQYLIVDMGLNITDIGYNGRNCFMLAIYGKQTGLLRFIDAKDPDQKFAIDDDKNTALTVAGGFADEKTFKLLIEDFGMNITTSKGFNGRNAFITAASRGNLETLRYMFSIDEDLVNTRDDKGTNALNAAAYAEYNSEGEYSVTLDQIAAFLDTVKALIEDMGMNPSETGFLDRNAFMSAVGGSQFATVLYLDAFNSTLKNAVDSFNDNPLTLAAFEANLKTIQTLVEAPINFNTSLTGYKGRTAFSVAAEKGRIEVLKYLQFV